MLFKKKHINCKCIISRWAQLTMSETTLKPASSGYCLMCKLYLVHFTAQSYVYMYMLENFESVVEWTFTKYWWWDHLIRTHLLQPIGPVAAAKGKIGQTEIDIICTSQFANMCSNICVNCLSILNFTCSEVLVVVFFSFFFIDISL